VRKAWVTVYQEPVVMQEVKNVGAPFIFATTALHHGE
jgi:hypothetical protein